MADPGVKISYVAALFRVRAEITKKAALASPQPPADLMQRAKAKMESVQKEKSIDFYIAYPERLAKIWAALREAKNEPDDLSISVTLAAGSPDIPGIRVQKPDTPKAHIMLSIDSPASEVANWRLEWFKLCVAKKSRDMGIQGPANPAQVQAAFMKAQAGESVKNLPISPNAAGQSPDDLNKQFSVVANKNRGEIAIVVRDVLPLRDRVHVDNIIAVVNQAAAKLEVAAGRSFVVHKKELVNGLKAAISGPELLGLDMPLTLLAASATTSAKASAKAANYPGAHKISVSVSDDKMEASISGFSRMYYDDPTFQVNLEWLTLELDRLGITGGRDAELMKAVSELLVRKETLEGVQIARGKEGVGAKGPFIFATYKEAKATEQAPAENAQVDIREMQQRAIVRQGQVVAEIRYQKPAVAGYNVFGHSVPAPPNEALSVKIGEGIHTRDQIKFLALADGLPVIEGNSVSLSKAFIHNGDVNLRSGNVRFDGPVEIKGSVDSGAVVDVKGHLTIHGTVRGGYIRSADSIEVKGGVITGPTGKLVAKFDITADFIENSRIQCGGELKVKKAIINSDVVAGKSIQTIDADGIVAGGALSCKEFVKAGNLGFKRGAVTELNIGVDYRIEIAIKIRTARLDKVQKKQGEDRQALREIVSKKREQMTARHEEMKVKLQHRLQKARVLIEKCEAHLAKAKANLKYDPSARIYVANQLAANCKIVCGGQAVQVPNDVAGVAITPRRRRGSFICAIEDLEAEMKESMGETKKAG